MLLVQPHFDNWGAIASQPSGASRGACDTSRDPKWEILPILKEWGRGEKPGSPGRWGPLTTRIQLFGLHCQVIPGVDFSVQFFLIVNVPLLGNSEELALVTCSADEVSAKGESFTAFQCSLPSPNSSAWQTGPFGMDPCAPSVRAEHCILLPRGFLSSDIIPLILGVLPWLGGRPFLGIPSAALSEFRQAAL